MTGHRFRIISGSTQLGAALLLALAACHPKPVTRPQLPQLMATPAGVHITMDALHKTGGVPLGWRFTPPAGDPTAGRQAFVDFGCYSCHTVEGESFPAKDDSGPNAGPDLSGMGSHHPPEYFAESILNPNAVVVDGPGYAGSDGRSVMPAYLDMTVAELADLVSYLQSLGGPMVRSPVPPGFPPAPQRPEASSFFVQGTEVTSAQLRVFDDWFVDKGAEQLRAVDGLVSVDTYVNRAHGARLLVMVIGFGDDDAEQRFTRRLDAAGADDLARMLHGGQRSVFRSRDLYKAVGLSIP